MAEIIVGDLDYTSADEDGDFVAWDGDDLLIEAINDGVSDITVTFPAAIPVVRVYGAGMVPVPDRSYTIEPDEEVVFLFARDFTSAYLDENMRLPISYGGSGLNLKIRAIGLSAMNQGGGGGGPTPSGRMPFGFKVGGTGDGLFAPGGGVGNGPNNFMQRLLLALGGKGRPVQAPHMGQSGTRIKNANGSQAAWIPSARGAIRKQRPNWWIYFSCGHNDGLMNNDPASSQQMLDWKDEVANTYADWAAYAGPTDCMTIVGTIPSTVSGESTWRSAVWAAQAAYAATFTALNPRVRFLSVTALGDNTGYSIDTASSYTHSDERMPNLLVPAILTLMADCLPVETIEDYIAAVLAGTYAGMAGAQLDASSAMTGTGGSVSGTGASIGGDGSLPTGKIVTLSMGGITCVASRVLQPDGSYSVQCLLNGTVTSAGKLMFGDSSNQARTATPGRYFNHAIRVKSSKGGHTNFGADWGTQSMFAGGASSLNTNNLCGGNADAITDAVMPIIGNPTWGSDTSYTGMRRWAIYWPVGTVFNNDIVEFHRPLTYEVSDRTTIPADYIGDTIGTGGTPIIFFGNNARLRLTGSYSAASGGTIRLEPGEVVPAGLGNSDFTDRSIWAGSSSDTAVDSGTKIHTYAGASWSATVASGLATAGQTLWGQTSILDPVTGTTKKFRSRLTTDSLTVAA